MGTMGLRILRDFALIGAHQYGEEAIDPCEPMQREGGQSLCVALSTWEDSPKTLQAIANSPVCGNRHTELRADGS